MDNIIIIGCPRSGTGYASKFFTSNGIEVGHERLASHGISSWCLATGDDSSLYGPSYIQVIDKLSDFKVYHQVREPIACISSLQSISDTAYTYMLNKLSIGSITNKLEGLMYIWLEWNILAEQLASDTYQIELIADKFKHLEPYQNTKYNTRTHLTLSKKDLKLVNQSLAEKVFQKAQQYGYNKSE